ncbi:hypothetical protein [uncultured Mycobacterium sp.]|uniref:hypothetical protein n=1 Tax=uncultured Mycobacterium sp. TaxID=171292 RepID=UPI0035CAD502
MAQNESVVFGHGDFVTLARPRGDARDTANTAHHAVQVLTSSPPARSVAMGKL